MSLNLTIPDSGMAVTAVIAGLYILSLFFASLTSNPPVVAPVREKIR